MLDWRTCGRIVAACGLCLLWPAGHAPADWDPERWATELDEAADLETILQSGPNLRVDINRASRSSLEALDLFSPGEVERIVSGRPWASVKQAVRAVGPDPLRARIMEALLFVSRSPPDRRGALCMRIGEGGAGGWPLDARVATRVRMRLSAAVVFGAVQEKDPGEAALADHTAGYVDIGRRGSRDHLVLGHYTLRFGQGMLFWPGGLGGAAISRFQRSGGGAQGFSGTGESGALRGAALQTERGRWLLLVFYSDRSLDARVDASGAISGFPVTGYHRTEKERAEKGRGRERLLGGRLAWRRGADRVGLTLYRQRYSDPVVLGDSDRDGVRFRGESHRAASSDWCVTRGGRSFFGEITMGRRPSFVAGFVEVRGRIEGLAWFCGLDRSLYSPHGSLVGVRGASMRNLSAAVLGLRLKPRSRLVLSILANLESRPWRTWAEPLPPRGSEMILEAEWSGRQLDVSGEWKTSHSPYLEAGEKRTVRRALRVRLRSGERGRISCDLKESEDDDARGTLARISATARLGTWSVAGTLVTAWLQPGAPSLYAYAGSLPGEMRFMQASRSGSGASIMVSADILSRLELSVHCERSHFMSRREWYGIQIEARI